MDYVCVEDFKNKAEKVLEKSALDYYRSGAGDQYTLNRTKASFQKLCIRPRFLRDVSKLDTSTTIFGCDLKWPVGIAPTAMQRLAHPDGEVANARAAGKAGSIFILSTIATTSIEELAEKAPNTDKWFQLYVYKDRALTESLVRRAEKANFKALVLTVDAPIFGQRRSDVRNKFGLPSHLQLGNFSESKTQAVKSSGKGSGINEYVMSQFDPQLTWKDVEWLVKLTKLPVIAKGILTKEDAVLAKEFGCKGIIVSNHGARQLDSVPTSIEALPEIERAVGNDLVVMMDGGISDGNDILKALALGAKMVFIGRPALWGLACGGQKGVEDLLNILKKDFELVMSLSGCTDLKSILRNLVVHETSYFSKL